MKYIQGKGKNQDRYYIWIVVNANGKRTRKTTGEYVSQDYSEPLLDAKGKYIIRRKKLVFPKVLPQDFEALEIAKAYLKKIKASYRKQKHGNIIKDVFVQNKNFIVFFENRISYKKGQSGYFAALKLLKDFINGSVLSYNEITLKFLNRFRKFLLDNNDITQNTARHYLGLIRGILNEARAEEDIDIDPFQHFKAPKQNTKEKEYLTLSEVKKISQYSNIISIKRQYSLDAFIFNCFTGGLRISDLRTLKWSDVKEEYIITTQKKTGDDVKIFLHPVSRHILKKYKDKGHSRVFEFMLSQSANLHFLKEVVKELGIDKKVTSHTARHTYTTLAAQFSNDIHSTSKLVGHRNTKTTQSYLHTTDERLKKVVNSIPSIY